MEYRMKVLFFEIKVSEEILTHTVSVDKYAINQINDIVGGQDLWRNF